MKSFSFKIWEFEYNSETKVLACLNDSIIVKDVSKKNIKDAFRVVESLYNSYVYICGDYKSLLGKYQKLQITNHLEPHEAQVNHLSLVKKKIYFNKWEFEYDSEAKVLKCLNGHIVVTDILEMHIDIALYIILYFNEVNHWSYIDMTYRSLTDEFNVATVF